MRFLDIFTERTSLLFIPISKDDKIKLEKLMQKNNGLENLPKGKEINLREEASKDIGDLNSLNEQELNRYIYLCLFYLKKIREEDPVKAQKINGLLIEETENNEKLSFSLRAILKQNEILSLFYNGEFGEINDNFQNYIDYIENILKNLENDKIKNILKLDLITFLFINLSLCVYDDEKTNIILNLGNKLETILNENGLQKHKILVQQSIYKCRIKSGKKATLNIGEIEETIKKIEEQDYEIKFLQFNKKDKYQFLITKLEYLIKNDGEEEDIEKTIEEIENQENQEFDLKIHFEYLKALYLKNKGSIKGFRNRTKKIIEDLITTNGINYIEYQIKSDNYHKSKEILKKLLEENCSIENKILLLEPLILLINLLINEEKKEIIGEKKEEITNEIKKYFFTALGYLEKHFGDENKTFGDENNYYGKKLIQLGKEIFPLSTLDGLNDKYTIFKLNIEKKQVSEIIISEFDGINSYEFLKKSLKEYFQVEDIFIYSYGFETINLCKGFNKNINGEHNCKCKDCTKKGNINCLLLSKELIDQLSETKWNNIQISSESVNGIINSSFFSETLEGKIITIGPNKLIVYLSRGRKNKTKLTPEELIKIEGIYFHKILGNEMLEGYSLNEAVHQKKLERLYEELKNLTEKNKKTLSGLSHDMNNILTTIIGLPELMVFKIEDISKIINTLEINIRVIKEKGLINESEFDNIIQLLITLKKYFSNESNEKIHPLLNNVNMIKEAGNDIKDLTRQIGTVLEEKNEIKEFETIEINSFIEDFIEGQRNIINSEKKDIEIYFNNKEKINVDCIEGELKRVLGNIIGNAIKFIQSKGKIEISTKKFGKFIAINISDNGIGIKEKDLEKIFKYREQVGEKEMNNKGKGIGLYNCKKIIEEDHKGKITAISSGLGTGATFQIVLPIKQN